MGRSITGVNVIDKSLIVVPAGRAGLSRAAYRAGGRAVSDFFRNEEVLERIVSAFPFAAVMKHLGFRGIDCGIGLKYGRDRITFKHAWLLLVLEK